MSRCLWLVTVLILGGAVMAQAQSSPPADAGTAPMATLSNPRLSLQVALPDATKGYYRGSRFDWSGIVTRVSLPGGRTVFGPWKKTHNPLNHDDIAGTSEEFGMDVTPGYAEAAAGETFVKIGIGELEKPATDKKYSFGRNYKVAKPGSWKVTLSDAKDAITFEQSLQGPRGIGYRYTKKLALDPAADGFTIARELVNTGTYTIETDHYGHNFTVVDDQPVVGSQYAVEFPFELKPAAIETPIKDPSGIVKLEGKRFSLTGDLPTGKTFHVTLAGYSGAEHNRFRLINTKAGLAMVVTGDRPMTKLAVWSMNPVICPEPFVALSLKPGQTLQWTTTYRFEKAN